MLIPYSFTEQQWSVSWMNGGKPPLREPRLTAWETPETLETRELSERSTSNLCQLKACTLLSQELWRLPDDLFRQFSTVATQKQKTDGGGGVGCRGGKLKLDRSWPKEHTPAHEHQNHQSPQKQRATDQYSTDHCRSLRNEWHGLDVY